MTSAEIISTLITVTDSRCQAAQGKWEIPCAPAPSPAKDQVKITLTLQAKPVVVKVNMM